MAFFLVHPNVGPELASAVRIGSGRPTGGFVRPNWIVSSVPWLGQRSSAGQPLTTAPGLNAVVGARPLPFDVPRFARERPRGRQRAAHPRQVPLVLLIQFLDSLDRRWHRSDVANDLTRQPAVLSPVGSGKSLRDLSPRRHCMSASHIGRRPRFDGVQRRSEPTFSFSSGAPGRFEVSMLAARRLAGRLGIDSPVS